MIGLTVFFTSVLIAVIGYFYLSKHFDTTGQERCGCLQPRRRITVQYPEREGDVRGCHHGEQPRGMAEAIKAGKTDALRDFAGTVIRQHEGMLVTITDKEGNVVAKRTFGQER